MATVVVMPQLGNSVESCLIVSWAVGEGDTVAENAVLCEVETDKATMEVPSPSAGTVLKLLFSEGDDVPVKEPLLVLGEHGEDPGPALEAAGVDQAPASEPDTTVQPAGEASYEGTGDREQPGSGTVETLEVPDPAGDQSAVDGRDEDGVPGYGSSPRARTLAASTSLDLSAVGSGTGPGGRVIERDVRAALDAGPTTHAAAKAGGAGRSDLAGSGIGGRSSVSDVQAADQAPAPSTGVATDDGDMGPSTTTPVKGIRKVISERMMHSLASSAQLTYTTTARAQRLLDLRKRLKGSDPSFGLAGVTIGDLVGFAAVRTASRHASHNAHLSDGVLTTFERVHMGFACDTPRGLLVPTVRNASLLGLGEFAAASKHLASQAIDGTITPDLLQGATFTVTNLGGLGIESFTPLLNVPQTAILGVDAIFPRAVINDDGTLGAEPRIGLSLTADHRAIDGADAARFLSDLVAFLENIDVAVLA